MLFVMSWKTTSINPYPTETGVRCSSNAPVGQNYLRSISLKSFLIFLERKCFLCSEERKSNEPKFFVELFTEIYEARTKSAKHALTSFRFIVLVNMLEQWFSHRMTSDIGLNLTQWFDHNYMTQLIKNAELDDFISALRDDWTSTFEQIVEIYGQSKESFSRRGFVPRTLREWFLLLLKEGSGDVQIDTFYKVVQKTTYEFIRSNPRMRQETLTKFLKKHQLDQLIEKPLDLYHEVYDHLIAKADKKVKNNSKNSYFSKVSHDTLLLEELQFLQDDHDFKILEPSCSKFGLEFRQVVDQHHFDTFHISIRKEITTTHGNVSREPIELTFNSNILRPIGKSIVEPVILTACSPIISCSSATLTTLEAYSYIIEINISKYILLLKEFTRRTQPCKILFQISWVVLTSEIFWFLVRKMTRIK